ncbi:hypothetical protein SAMD00020551_3417 [Mesobacillus selenatarsenatis SF-1]|uniref:Uncharacterized protein n=1 Tax=Mesobacillus selenatarsenatis (strain DSM 18680 / JCM 14380 / FERM P-15431 / SF-1) TaxID=1321606 RepID=A0A0A8XAR9_MESS1|nr:hypothetical protein SAMD00020551_3417 [Mesobacillus selenatarsenatis SF-1]
MLTACSDPSPLKSDIEVKINELFGTKFGLLDQVYIQSEGKTLTVLNPSEFLGYLEGAEKTAGEEITGAIVIVLKTSSEMKEYSKEQTIEELSFVTDNKLICNEDYCYKTSKELADLIESLK